MNTNCVSFCCYFMYGQKVKSIFKYFGCTQKDEESFSLMRAQHFIAQMLSFDNWNDLLNASDEELKLSRIILENCHDEKQLSTWWDFFNYAKLDDYCIESQINICTSYFSGNEYAEISKPEQKRAIEKQKSIRQLQPEDKVRCIHCEDVFLFKEAKVCFDLKLAMSAICCKNNPSCSGTIIDFFSAE